MKSILIRYRLICLCLLLICTCPVLACDICGGGAGTSYMGLLPEFRHRFIGVRYQYNSLYNHLGPGGQKTYLSAHERFHLAELWGASNIGTRFRASFFLPYNFMERSSQGVKSTATGIGDASLIGYYRLLDRNPDETPSHRQSLWVGAGLKLPTGRYDPGEHNLQSSSQNTFQLGTGSADISFHAMYDLKWTRAGMNVNARYKINTANRYEYRYGNKLTLNALGYYRFSGRSPGSFSVMPNAGLMFETASKDWKTHDIRIFETGGTSLMVTAGLELSKGRMGAGMNYQAPVGQKLGEGKMKVMDRGMIYLSYSF